MKTKQNNWLDLFEDTRQSYLDKARMIARSLLEKRPYITVDDIRLICPPPEEVDGRVMGAVLKHPDFESIGWIRSTRRINHGRPVQKFRMKVISDASQTI